MVYIFGGSGSGKSKFAEDEILRLEKEKGFSIEKVYLATMKVCGEEARLRIEKHRLQRKDKGFRTIEAYENISDIDVGSKSLVLLECMSNFVANNKFMDDGSVRENALVIENLWEDLCSLDIKCLELVIVGNDIYNDDLETKKKFSKETLDYIDLMYALHERILKRASKVREVVFGVEVD